MKTSQEWAQECSPYQKHLAEMVEAVRDEFAKECATQLRKRVASTNSLGMREMAHAYELAAMQIEVLARESK